MARPGRRAKHKIDIPIEKGLYVFGNQRRAACRGERPKQTMKPVKPAPPFRRSRFHREKEKKERRKWNDI